VFSPARSWRCRRRRHPFRRRGNRTQRTSPAASSSSGFLKRRLPEATSGRASVRRFLVERLCHQRHKRGPDRPVSCVCHPYTTVSRNASSRGRILTPPPPPPPQRTPTPAPCAGHQASADSGVSTSRSEVDFRLRLCVQRRRRQQPGWPHRACGAGCPNTGIARNSRPAADRSLPNLPALPRRGRQFSWISTTVRAAVASGHWLPPPAGRVIRDAVSPGRTSRTPRSWHFEK